MRDYFEIISNRVHAIKIAVFRFADLIFFLYFLIRSSELSTKKSIFFTVSRFLVTYLSFIIIWRFISASNRIRSWCICAIKVISSGRHFVFCSSRMDCCRPTIAKLVEQRRASSNWVWKKWVGGFYLGWILIHGLRPPR